MINRKILFTDSFLNSLHSRLYRPRRVSQSRIRDSYAIDQFRLVVINIPFFITVFGGCSNIIQRQFQKFFLFGRSRSQLGTPSGIMAGTVQITVCRIRESRDKIVQCFQICFGILCTAFQEQSNLSLFHICRPRFLYSYTIIYGI